MGEVFMFIIGGAMGSVIIGLVASALGDILRDILGIKKESGYISSNPIGGILSIIGIIAYLIWWGNFCFKS